MDCLNKLVASKFLLGDHVYCISINITDPHLSHWNASLRTELGSCGGLHCSESKGMQLDDDDPFEASLQYVPTLLRSGGNCQHQHVHRKQSGA